MLTDTQIADIWLVFADYLDKKQIEIVAEKYVDLLADYGVNDKTFQNAQGVDSVLDNAIDYYLDEEDDEDDDYKELDF